MPRKQQPMWENSEVQFARLICEIDAALDTTQTHSLIGDLSVSMDLSISEVYSLFSRAESVWSKAKGE